MPPLSASRLAAIAWTDDAPVIVDQRRFAAFVTDGGVIEPPFGPAIARPVDR